MIGREIGLRKFYPVRIVNSTFQYVDPKLYYREANLSNSRAVRPPMSQQILNCLLMICPQDHQSGSRKVPLKGSI